MRKAWLLKVAAEGTNLISEMLFLAALFPPSCFAEGAWGNCRD